MLSVLITAYRRTGKTTLQKRLATGESEFSYLVYSDKPFSPSELDEIKLVPRSFAEALKKEAVDEYGIPESISDEEKDIKRYIHPTTGELSSARDFYIEWGAFRRGEDIDYWCKKGYEGLTTDETGVSFGDWRFVNEVAYAIKLSKRVITIRIYRSDVPIPPMKERSEHELDAWETDLLLVKNQEEFERALKLFPQYRSYSCVGKL